MQTLVEHRHCESPRKGDCLRGLDVAALGIDKTQ